MPLLGRRVVPAIRLLKQAFVPATIILLPSAAAVTPPRPHRARLGARLPTAPTATPVTPPTRLPLCGPGMPWRARVLFRNRGPP
ncbi:hypothetical protein NDU88_009880 [Pleurodeles waltl]|uniref:Secreted protein n=1 Tax=Pleurodeles waltl TaxID=8319 RepID=A0AAV7S0A0_PLEWA|nr:hypothetical protein NDU88_009880 [Pleurodeles waltl]